MVREAEVVIRWLKVDSTDFKSKTKMAKTMKPCTVMVHHISTKTQQKQGGGGCAQYHNLIYLTDIPRQREEYEVMYGTRRNASCHNISLLFFKLEWTICFIIRQIYNPEWCIRKHISNSKKLKINCSIIIQNINRPMYSKDM